MLTDNEDEDPLGKLGYEPRTSWKLEIESIQRGGTLIYWSSCQYCCIHGQPLDEKTRWALDPAYDYSLPLAYMSVGEKLNTGVDMEDLPVNTGD